MKITSRMALVPAALAIAGAALLALPATAGAVVTAEAPAAVQSERAGPYSQSECEEMRYVFMHYGYQVGGCYEWYPTGTGPTPAGGWWFNYWV